MKICGLQKTTLLDYPGHVAATVFLGGCNFRCPFCHNAELLGNDAEPLMSLEDLILFLRKRQATLEGVCITGGEPTMDPDGLRSLIVAIRELELLVKLDTNGSRPTVLKELCADGLIDYVAMDIKTSQEHYPLVSGNPFVDLDAICESVEFLKFRSVPYEFRTTVVKGLHTVNDFPAIGKWLEGADQYFLQNYVASDRVLKPDGFSAYSKKELLEFMSLAAPYVKKIQLRGIDY